MNTRPFRAIIGAALVLAIAGAALAEENAMTVTVVDTPAVVQGATHYAFNRAPLAPNPLAKLPIGAIRPEGWLRHQLELMTDGMIGRLPEVSRWCQFDDSAWTHPKGEGKYGWEEMPYWLKGFGDLGYVLDDERITSEARRWIDAILATQRDSGYFGPQANLEQNDIWPNMIALNVLQSFYEATGDERVLPFLTNYFRWELDQGDNLLPGSWQAIRAGDNLESIYWLYNRTGDAFLLDAARLVHRRAANWTEGIASWHGVNICQSYREPAVYFQQAGDRAFLNAAERNYREVMDLYGQVPGGMFGADENARPGYTGPRQAAETCSMVEFMLSFEMLLGITGDPKFADRCEDVAFNSLPASMTADLKGLHYLTAPNMVQLDQESKSPLLQNGGCMLAYSPGERYRCCQHNVSHGWPYFAEHLWMATGDNGLAAVLLAANKVKAKVGESAQEVAIDLATDYPFDDTLRFTVHTGAPVAFPLYVRLPHWVNEAHLEINDKVVKVDARPTAFLRIERTWQDGDEIKLTLPMNIRVRTWDKNHNSVSVDRGPLTYSLKIGERWEKFGGSDEWPEWEVYPTTPWNYGLVLDPSAPAKSVEVIAQSREIAPQPFTVEAAPIVLKAKARRIPEWTMEQGLVGKLQNSPARVETDVEDVTLIPMACARLRISAFPTVSDAAEAHTWEEYFNPFSASHCHDSLLAVSDGVDPRNSDDHSIPRFTWWSHKGTTEWIQWEFRKAKTVRGVEVYWFDDEPRGGHCRVPASWKCLYRAGDTWQEVPNAAAYGLEKDRFNAVTFDAVATDALRIEVQLRPEFSGGILEWRLSE
ncbi:MAG TPA: glycoside hydrolase family 127 protein [Candidatus Hydrogenedentes bacterium]|nr:glycoside hydrolase family 127 protein [Candidatus Hydrogenedentota bacterium]HPG69539.1 glycoside hydrolase family 127 protein [Candidatus Hydrogenedentota bacterium]